MLSSPGERAQRRATPCLHNPQHNPTKKHPQTQALSMFSSPGERARRRATPCLHNPQRNKTKKHPQTQALQCFLLPASEPEGGQRRVFQKEERGIRFRSERGQARDPQPYSRTAMGSATPHREAYQTNYFRVETETSQLFPFRATRYVFVPATFIPFVFTDGAAELAAAGAGAAAPTPFLGTPMWRLPSRKSMPLFMPLPWRQPTMKMFSSVTGRWFSSSIFFATGMPGGRISAAHLTPG